jgi:hypothetical protein
MLFKKKERKKQVAGFLLAQGSGWQTNPTYVVEDVPTIYGLEAIVAKAKNTLTYAILGLQKMKLAATIPSNGRDDGILKNGRVENPLLPMGLQPLAEETPSTLGHILSTRLTNGVIGLAIVLCLFAITQLFSSLFGINLLEFTIPRL